VPNVKEHDVVQIVPEHGWGGCYLHVTELKDWGVMGFVKIPLQGNAYIRIKHDEYEKIGSAVFVPIEEGDEE
jgi:hypothetical protein